MSLDSLCRWQVQVSVYCAWRIPAHLRCTQCSILLHLMDICFLTCICLWQISQIQTFLFKVVGPGLVSTSPQVESAVTAPPLVDCVVWSLILHFSYITMNYILMATKSKPSVHFTKCSGERKIFRICLFILL